ncbi:hypothetical protein A2333_01560 [Candidatus Wolfebacteria bacterium RIFOXYB2_FULL_49_7]|uniref:Uncharacterized protein n=1 Tax=Candidatus Wolfebacteria bacterium RIFOXYB1_FULL_54_12 TaxID=1802559 RepID=A0A1F8DW97_9BACT|nr:MAG: hypothetical protein A2372_01180 [Candidatus Wolfebacteria bacterium RIFOXYB1_FULL_54_12]OGM93591.1 MAG: hypothetical protein A2333_01560 [Candidatus Wolfebacteria bacterium RIFOXYB2_FULL_49_7]
MKSVPLKKQVFALRDKGYSYNLISQKLGVSKGTLSAWFKDVPFTPNKLVLQRIKAGPLKSGQVRHAAKLNATLTIKEAAKKEIGTLSKRDLQMVGLGLYLGEGSKLYETIRIINSDPKTVKLAVLWLKEICGLDNANITVAVHLYPDNDIKKCLSFWSKQLAIPLSQFRKTQIDTRSNKSAIKKHKLPYGTAHISVISKGNPEHGVALHRKIIGWLEACIDQV